MGYRLKKRIRVSDLTLRLGLSFQGVDAELLGVSTLDDQSLGFLVFSKIEGKALAGSIIVEPANGELSNHSDVNYTTIESNNPRLDFIRLLDVLATEIGFSTYEFASKIHESAVIGPNVVIEAGCTVGENVIIEIGRAHV